MKSYLEKLKGDKGVGHHKFMASVRQYVEEVNSGGKKRVRNIEALRNPQKLTIDHHRDRELVAGWRQAVPVDRWAEAYPGVPLPTEASSLGTEILNGKPTAVVYVAKPGSQAWHYDVITREGSSASQVTTLHTLKASDSSDAAKDAATKKAAVWQAKVSEFDKCEGVKVVNPDATLTDRLPA